MAALVLDFRRSVTKVFFSASESPAVPKICLGVKLSMCHPEMAYENRTQRAPLHEQTTLFASVWLVLDGEGLSFLHQEKIKRGVSLSTMGTSL